jgi:hypothetical protein
LGGPTDAEQLDAAWTVGAIVRDFEGGGSLPARCRSKENSQLAAFVGLQSGVEPTANPLNPEVASGLPRDFQASDFQASGAGVGYNDLLLSVVADENRPPVESPATDRQAGSDPDALQPNGHRPESLPGLDLQYRLPPTGVRGPKSHTDLTFLSGNQIHFCASVTLDPEGSGIRSAEADLSDPEGGRSGVGEGRRPRGALETRSASAKIENRDLC